MKQANDFWSRRKQAVEAEAETEIAEQVAHEEQQSLEALEEKSDDEILEELGLQDPETLEAGDDFSAFMSKAVPTRIRNKALRKLWLSNPALANLDALVDYGEDFTDSAMAVENIQTAYQVGKGMFTHVMEMARKEEEAKAKEQGVASDEETPEMNAADIIEDTELAAFESAAQEDDDPLGGDVTEMVADDEDVTEAEVAFVPRRRMRFVIEAQS